MALLDDQSREQVREIFASRLEGEVELLVFTQHDSPLIIPSQECQYCQETRELAEELAALSDHLTLTVHDFVKDAETAEEMGIDKIPALVLRGRNRGNVRYFGIPSGYEFSGLIEDIIDVSRGTTSLSDQTRQRLEAAQGPLHIQVFVTPT